MESMEGNVTGRPSSDNTSTKLCRIAELARQIRGQPLTSLSHHIDIEFLEEAYRRTRKDGAHGVDGITATEYEANLQENLQTLLNRAKSGSYKAPPVRRVRIPKNDGKETRPIGIPTLEDKILQKAVTMVLVAVYEEEFKDFSYGFRPRRGQHDALERIRRGLTGMGGAWVLEVDIRSFFDTLDKKLLQELLAKRVSDGVVRRLVGKWLHAGVMEAGELSYPEKGTPQGGVISPLLANVYLHHVLDEWWTDMVEPYLKGEGFMVRFADDLVMVLEKEGDARRAEKTLPKRLAKFGLRVHEGKTRIVDMRKPRKRPDSDDEDQPGPGTLDFLGFTLHWTETRKGTPVVRMKTSGKRFRNILKRTNQWLKWNRHKPVAWQHKKLSQSLRGHDAYFGVTGNSRMLHKLRYHVARMWRKWLNRRSHAATKSWDRFRETLLRHYPLPRVRIVHSAHRAAKP